MKKILAISAIVVSVVVLCCVLGAKRQVRIPTNEPMIKPAREMKLDLGQGMFMEFVWIDVLNMWVAKYETTRGEYERYDPRHLPVPSSDGNRLPVVQITFRDAKAFVAWLNSRAVLPAGYKARLPDGKEWTTFAQCGDGRIYPWGNHYPPWRGNYGPSKGQRPAHGVGICPVEKSGGNAWGLYGVGGNVWELTSDTYPGQPQWHYVRGAAWNIGDPDFLSCAFALPTSEETCKSDVMGFRVVVSR